jgi:hypothetical protein
MIILDENFPRDQIESVRGWTASVLSVGDDFGEKGMSDELIVADLRTMTRPTFFSLDKDFYDRSLRDRRYCLVWLDVTESVAANYVRRVLRHVDFRTKGQRLGCVISAAPAALKVWRWKAARESYIAWHE